jgi:predicted nucleic acid-binding protein
MIDTDVFSFLTWQRGPHKLFGPFVEGHVLAISFACVAELRAGALIAEWGEQRRYVLEERIRNHYVVLTATDGVTRMFAEIYKRFREQLKGGGINDMWTAAVALAQPEPTPIVTNDLSDFSRIATAFPLVVVHPEA